MSLSNFKISVVVKMLNKRWLNANYANAVTVQVTQRADQILLQFNDQCQHYRIKYLSDVQLNEAGL